MPAGQSDLLLVVDEGNCRHEVPAAHWKSADSVRRLKVVLMVLKSVAALRQTDLFTTALPLASLENQLAFTPRLGFD